MSSEVGVPNSFSARRPNASNLPHFELPSPHFGTFKSQGYSNGGQLLTPPTGSSFGSNDKPNIQGVQPSYPCTPTGRWPASDHSASYAFPAATSPGFNNQPRTDFFQAQTHSLLRRSETMPNQSMPPQSPFTDNHGYPTNLQMTAPPTLPTLQTAVGSQYPQTANDAFARPMHSAGFYPSSQPSPAASFGAQFSTGPSPTTQTPVDQSLPRHSPGLLGGMPPLHHAHTATPPASYGQRPFFHPLPGPLAATAGSPTAQLGMGANGFPGLSAYSTQPMHQYDNNTSHMMLNDRPFRCDQCPQSFNRNHDLKRHKRIHLAVKPFPCGHCDKSFSRKDALKRHILVKGCGKAVRPAATCSDDERASEDSVSPIPPDCVNFGPPVPHSA